MKDSLAKLLLRRSESGRRPVVWGREAAPYFGRAFDRLLSEGILTERALATVWPPCRQCDGACGERDIVEMEGDLVAECPEYPDMDSHLTPNDVRSFEIDAPLLVAKFMRESVLGQGSEPLGAGAWLLGRTDGGRWVVLVMDPSGFHGPDGLTLIAARAPSAETTILVPDNVAATALRPFRAAGFHIVSTVSALPDEGFRLDHALLHPRATVRARLFINKASSTVLLDGRRVSLTDQPRRLLVALAEVAITHAGFLDRTQVQHAVYGSLRPPDSRPLRDVARDLRDQMAVGLSGAEADDVRRLIENQRVEKYRLALTSSEIDISD